MDSSLPKTTGHDLGSKQLHNEKLLITNFFAAVSGDKEHGFKMVESFGHHLASIIRPINMEHIIPTPPSISFNHGGKSVISTLPSVLTHNSASGTANLCHSSVGSVVSTPLRGNWNDLSCSVQATDGGVSNVRSANELLSVSTNTSDESVPRSATVPSPHCGKEGGQSRIINLVAEGVPVELERDRCYSFDGFCSGSSQGDPKRRCIVDTMSPIENDLSAIEKYLISEKKDLDPLSNLPLSHDFAHVMDFLESHDMKDTYPYDKQCLVILDLVLPVTSHPTFTTKSKLLQNIIISERSSDNWQLYVAKDLGIRDHFGCPSSNVIHLIKSVLTIQPHLSFTFIPERCPLYKCPMFRICSFLPSPDDEVATYMALLLKTSLPNFPTTSSSNSKRGSALAHSIGLQYQCANQHHLSRFCQNNNSVPSVNLGSPFNAEAKRYLLHASLSVLEKEKNIFENSHSPFALVD